MGSSVSQKIIARAAGLSRVATGDHVEVIPDWAMSYDPQADALQRRLSQRWGLSLWDPDRVILVADHFLDSENPLHRRRLEELESFARAFDVRHYYPLGAPNHGVCHALLPEEGFVRPGELIAGTDSHSSTYGGFGALGLNVGVDAMEGVLATGKHWLRAPREVRIQIDGNFPVGVTAKDVVLRLCAELTNSPEIFGAGIELDGEAVQELHPEEKLTIANMAQELGARWLVIPANRAVADWVRSLGVTDFTPVHPDIDASYDKVLRYDGSSFERMVALPGGPERAIPLSTLPQVRFNEVFIGSCTGAKLIDMKNAFQKLQQAGSLADGVSLMLAPATKKVRDWILSDPEREGFIRKNKVSLAEQPGCNACAGLHGFIAGDSAIRVSTGNRNYAGRMGAPGAQVFLASADIAAEAAIKGVLGR